MQQPPPGQGWPQQMQPQQSFGQPPTGYGQQPYPPQQGQWKQGPYPPQEGQWQQPITPNPTVVDDYCSAKPGLIREKEEVSLRHITNEFKAISLSYAEQKARSLHVR